MLKIFVLIFALIVAALGQIQPDFLGFPGLSPMLPPMEPMVPNFPIFPTSRPPENIWPFPNNNPTIEGTSVRPVADQNSWPTLFPTNAPNSPAIDNFRPQNPSNLPSFAPISKTTTVPPRIPAQVLTIRPQFPVNPTTSRPLPNLTFPPQQQTSRAPNQSNRPPNNSNQSNPRIKDIQTPWGTARYDSRCPMGFSQHPFYIPDETNCRKFYMCNFGIAWLMNCPPSVTGRVVWSQMDSACREVEDPGC